MTNNVGDIIIRPGKINHLDECLAIYMQYKSLNDGEPGSPCSNKKLAEKFNISRRAFLYKKAIGARINKNIRGIIIKNNILNNFKFLYYLSRRNHAEQETLIYRILNYLQTGLNLYEAMVATGLCKKRQDNNVEVPARKVPVMLQQDVIELAKEFLTPEWPLEHWIEHFLLSEVEKFRSMRVRKW